MHIPLGVAGLDKFVKKVVSRHTQAYILLAHAHKAVRHRRASILNDISSLHVLRHTSPYKCGSGCAAAQADLPTYHSRCTLRCFALLHFHVCWSIFVMPGHTPPTMTSLPAPAHPTSIVHSASRSSYTAWRRASRSLRTPNCHFPPTDVPPRRNVTGPKGSRWVPCEPRTIRCTAHAPMGPAKRALYRHMDYGGA